MFDVSYFEWFYEVHKNRWAWCHFHTYISYCTVLCCIVCMLLWGTYNVEIVFGWCVERVSGFWVRKFFTFLTFYSRLHGKNSISLCLSVSVLTVGIQNTDKSTSNFNTKLLSVGEHCDEFTTTHPIPSSKKYARSLSEDLLLFVCILIWKISGECDNV